MPWKTYSYARPNGRLNTFKVWLKGKFEKGKAKDTYSRRFGYLNLYNHTEQMNLICPSGYSISQCYNKLRCMWRGYKDAKKKGNLDRMKKYAYQIQDVQRDMGIDVASFPFLGIFGEKFVLYDKKTGQLKKEDHRKYLKAQQMRNLKLDVGKDEEIQTLVDDKLHEPQKQEVTVPMLVEAQNPQEEVLVMTDEIPFRKYGVCPQCDRYIYFDRAHFCEDETQTLVLSDNIPFHKN